MWDETGQQGHLSAYVLIVGAQRGVQLEGGLPQLVGVFQVVVQLGGGVEREGERDCHTS